MVEALEKLVDALSRLPTIGRKSAWRLALHLVERPQDELDELSLRIGSIRERVKTCVECYNYSDTDRCAICMSPSRDAAIICVVEKPTDVLSIERAGRYRGVYHVLGGLISPIDGITAEKLKIRELMARVQAKGACEVILGLGGSGDAETTAHYLIRLLGDYPVRVTRLARGLPAGMEIEYVDQITLCQALAERIDVRYGETETRCR